MKYIYNTTTILFYAVSVFAFAIIISTTEAQGGQLGLVVHVNGTLYCTANGSSNGNTTPTFPNATVQVSCTRQDVVANAPVNTTTNSNGAYLLVLIPRPNATVGSVVSSCELSVLTPLSNCDALLPSTGLLVSNLQFVRTVPVGFARITYMVAAGFRQAAAASLLV